MSEFQKSSRMILHVEDNADHAEIMEFYIKEFFPDTSITCLDDGEKAMDYIQNAGERTPYPWLVLLDLKLPKYNGHEILERMKQDEEFKKVPVVVFTTSTSTQDISDAFGKGANSFITKPLVSTDFDKTIQLIAQYWENNQHGHLIDHMNHDRSH